MKQEGHNIDFEASSVYHRVGGRAFFIELVDRFYQLVESDLVLRPLYPEDLEPGKRHLASFLAQYWGGPQDYSQERGHPRLRRRHMAFSIGEPERDSWITHMKSALDSMQINDEERYEITRYFDYTATLLMNR